MLTSKQVEAVGRMTLLFNEIEYAFELYIAQFISVPEAAISVFLAEQGMFRQKSDRFGKILGILAIEHPSCASHIDRVREWITKANDLAERRNKYVHAIVIEDFSANLPTLRMKRKNFVLNEAELNTIVGEIVFLVVNLQTQCDELLEMLVRARDAS